MKLAVVDKQHNICGSEVAGWSNGLFGGSSAFPDVASEILGMFPLLVSVSGLEEVRYWD